MVAFWGYDHDKAPSPFARAEDFQRSSGSKMFKEMNQTLFETEGHLQGKKAAQSFLFGEVPAVMRMPPLIHD